MPCTVFNVFSRCTSGVEACSRAVQAVDAPLGQDSDSYEFTVNTVMGRRLSVWWENELLCDVLISLNICVGKRPLFSSLPLSI